MDVIKKFDDVEHRKHFRMSKSTVAGLIEDYSHTEFYEKSNTWVRGCKKNSAENYIYVFLWFACNKTTLRAIGLQFNISISTAYKLIEHLMEYLIDIAPRHIQFPTKAEEKEEMANEFEKVSGSINVITPANKIRSTYANRHDSPSITLQAICSHDKKFIDVFTGIPGKIHDARVFKLSDIYNELPTICGKNYHILGDSAYPIREWCLTPFKGNAALAGSEQIYNKKISGTRVLIENTFIIFKSRFRQLLQIHMHNVNKISKFIISCCVLHNLCMTKDDHLNHNEMLNFEEAQNWNLIVPVASDCEAHLRRLGEIKRNALKESFTVL